MANITLTGSRLRARRNDLGLRQVDLARQVGISASYLNLIEHNRRRIGGKLLTALADALSADPAIFSEGAESSTLQGLRDAAGSQVRTIGQDRETPAPELDRVEDFAGRFPGWAAALVGAHRRIGDLEDTVATLTDRIGHDPHLAGALHDILSSVTAIQSTSAILTGDQQPDPAWQARFQRNIHEDSGRLAAASQALVGYLEVSGDARHGTATPLEELETWLAARDWHISDLEGADGLPPPALEALLSDADFKTQGARRIAQMWLARAQADASALPLSDLRAACGDGWPDPAELARQHSVPVAQAMRRLASLPPDLAPGPVGLLSVDGAGALTFRRPIDGFPLPRIGAGCPLWPIYEAMQRPNQPVSCLVELPGQLARRFRAFAASDLRLAGTYDTPPVFEATMLILPQDRTDGISVRPVGSTCRVCPRDACAARREPSTLDPANNSF